jgi:hypothetical protein
MVFDADLRRLEAITLAGLLADALERVWHRALRADLLRLGQIVLDLDAGEMLGRGMLGDRLTSPSMLALVRIDLCGALALSFLGRFDRCQDLDLVEQHRLIGVDRSGVGLLGGGAEVLRLDPAQLLFQEHYALAA